MTQGYGNKTIDESVEKQMLQMDIGTGPSARMVELAETLVNLTPGSNWCMFAKNGNDVTTLALTVARAQTGKKICTSSTSRLPWCRTSLD